MWTVVTNHARTCVPGNTVYAYRNIFIDKDVTIYVNSILDLLKVEISGVECDPPQLNEAQTVSPSPALSETQELGRFSDTCYIYRARRGWCGI